MAPSLRDPGLHRIDRLDRPVLGLSRAALAIGLVERVAGGIRPTIRLSAAFDIYAFEPHSS
ncbi:hypothetical protein DA075_21955 [Methylobacterium currus]|uniref:Uncharacterized protein n=1 Tax=Methylobacterium currus TaxID=2051553 RepID=A0A2R4WP07_9HYPH|nr:hypothetical protein DA075_21955 [Methylobacterium currus]